MNRIPNTSGFREPCTTATQALIEQGRDLQAHLHHFSYEEIQRYRKTLSSAVSHSTASKNDRELLEQTHQQLSLLLTTHIAFKTLKALSHTLKNQAFPLNLTEKERRLLHQFEYFQHTPIVSSPAERLLIKNQIWGAYQKTSLLPKQHITWIHGSTSSALPIITRVQQALHLPAPALIPTGILLQHHFVPLSGELYWGSRGINQTCLSGMEITGFSVAVHYAQMPHISSPNETLGKSLQEILTHPEAVANFGIYKTGLSPLKIKVLQFLHLRPASPTLEELERRIELFRTSVERLLDQNPLNFWGGYLSSHYREIAERTPSSPRTSESIQHGDLVIVNEGGRKRFGLFSSSTSPGQKRIIQVEADGLGIETELRDIHVPNPPLPYLPSPTFMEYKEHLKAEFEEIRTILHTVQPLGITKEEMEELIHPAFPIVWGSYSLQPETFKRGVMGEKIVRTEAAFLGRDIQIAFTDEAHQEMLQRHLQPYHVTVTSLAAGALLAAIPELQTIPIEQRRADTPSIGAETEPDEEI